MKTLLALVLLAFTVAMLPAPSKVGRQRQNDLCPEIKEVLDDFGKIRNGMTRRDLDKLFTEDGGISVRPQTRYLSRRCNYIKAEVHFKLVQAIDSTEFSPNDIIIEVSKPYLEVPFID
ncbi:MAG TPA: hypothetical protein VKH15_07780 [Candidatus Acidoferrum sp.]|nr:hypothetical protein [Candidatus Acidoferrum sp.]